MIGAKIEMKARDKMRITDPDGSTEYTIRTFRHTNFNSSVAVLYVRQPGYATFIRDLLDDGTETWHPTEPLGKWGWLLDLCREAGVIFPGEEEP